MKVAITSKGNNMESDVDSRFGRCRYFIVYDSVTGDINAFENEAVRESGGAGVKAAEFISKNDIELVLTGNVGPNAMSILRASGINVAIGFSGTVGEAIEKFENGDYNKVENPNVPPHSGI